MEMTDEEKKALFYDRFDKMRIFFIEQLKVLHTGELLALMMEGVLHIAVHMNLEKTNLKELFDSYLKSYDKKLEKKLMDDERHKKDKRKLV